MSGDLLGNGISVEKFSLKKFQQDIGKVGEAKDVSNYNYFTELQSAVNSGNVDAAQQAMAISAFSVQNDGSENSKNLMENNSILQQIKANAQKIINAFTGGDKQQEAMNQDGSNQKASQNGMLAPSIENVNEVKKVLEEQGDDDITMEDIQAFLESNPDFSE